MLGLSVHEECHVEKNFGIGAAPELHTGLHQQAVDVAACWVGLMVCSLCCPCLA